MQWSIALIDELVRGGVREAVISPGMRSAPLAWACAHLREDRADFKIWTVPDERSAGFFALGLAKASNRPPILICTSGTAGAHYLPALIEASTSRVPLLVLTADRPPELHGWGANQSIDQTELFGRYADSYLGLPPPEEDPAAFVHLRATAARASSDAQAKRGPVHLNVPLREPLMPVGPSPGPGTEADRSWPRAASLGRDGGAPWLDFKPARATPSAESAAILRQRLARAERPVIVCGPREPRGRQEDDFALRFAQWSERLGIPVLAEASSNLQRPVPHYEAVLRDTALAASLRPDLIVRLGGRLTTRVLQAFADSEAAHIVQLHEGGEPIDPNHRASLVLEGELSSWLPLLCDVSRRDRRYLEAWLTADARAARAFEPLDRADRPLCEPSLARAVAASIPADAVLAVGSSMPVRDLDAFSALRSSPLPTFASRGVAGIDGGLSTAFGLAAAGCKTVLLIGDTTFWHDLGGLLWGARLGLPLTVVVVNNGGGRIFSFLDAGLVRTEGTQAARLFDELLTMPLGFELSAAASLVGANYARPESVGRLKEDLLFAVRSDRISIVDARVDGEATVDVHRRLWAAAGV